MKRNAILALATVFLFAGCAKDNTNNNESVVFSAAGDITTKLNEFRSQLGTLNTTTGLTSGRREINWDGVPDSPVARQRGLVYDGADEAMVSKTQFAEINAPAASEFSAFSGTKTFAVTNALVWPVSFRVAGQTTPATIKGFGAVFSDVDKATSTYIEFFHNERSLGKFFAPVHDHTGSFSFLGVYFPAETVTHVKLGHEGRLRDGAKDITQGGPADLIILDDFIYSEPVAK
jgi:hypothetical protein